MLSEPITTEYSLCRQTGRQRPCKTTRVGARMGEATTQWITRAHAQRRACAALPPCDAAVSEPAARARAPRPLRFGKEPGRQTSASGCLPFCPRTRLRHCRGPHGRRPSPGCSGSDPQVALPRSPVVSDYEVRCERNASAGTERLVRNTSRSGGTICSIPTRGHGRFHHSGLTSWAHRSNDGPHAYVLGQRIAQPWSNEAQSSNLNIRRRANIARSDPCPRCRR